jgi:hypothetical protein
VYPALFHDEREVSALTLQEIQILQGIVVDPEQIRKSARLAA